MNLTFIRDFTLLRILVVAEKNINVKLSITDTPGFGDHIDNTDWYVCLLYTSDAADE